jgi:hypothetical protein
VKAVDRQEHIHAHQQGNRTKHPRGRGAGEVVEVMGGEGGRGAATRQRVIHYCLHSERACVVGTTARRQGGCSHLQFRVGGHVSNQCRVLCPDALAAFAQPKEAVGVVRACFAFAVLCEMTRRERAYGGGGGRAGGRGHGWAGARPPNRRARLSKADHIAALPASAHREGVHGNEAALRLGPRRTPTRACRRAHSCPTPGKLAPRPKPWQRWQSQHCAAFPAPARVQGGTDAWYKSESCIAERRSSSVLVAAACLTATPRAAGVRCGRPDCAWLS